MTQPQINDTKTVNVQLIEDNYTAALSAFKSAAKMKGLHVQRIVTVPYIKRKRPEDYAQDMVRRV